MDSESAAQFSSSQLGTHEYWENVYQRELDAFADTGDTGEIWFGEDTQERMVRWISETSDLPQTASVIDLGCGNGAMLMALREEGFTNLTGVDYSQSSIELAQRIAEKENVTDIQFQVLDILSELDAGSESHVGKYDLCMDKGTYDAISLKNPSDPSDRLTYVGNVRKMLSSDGVLLITSCNWTRDEMEKDFSKEFNVIGDLPAPSFTFAGKMGQTVTTLIMKQKDENS